jgi:hypothetical protein
MHDPHARGIGLEACGVAIDPGNHVVIDSYYGSRLPGA